MKTIWCAGGYSVDRLENIRRHEAREGETFSHMPPGVDAFDTEEEAAAFAVGQLRKLRDHHEAQRQAADGAILRLRERFPFLEREWRPVVGWEGTYEVSSDGLVRRNGSARPPTRGSLGRRGHYRRVVLCDGPYRRKPEFVHAVVAAAFIGPRPEGLCINHIDADKENNRCSNLEYVTPRENTAHAQRLGRLSAPPHPAGASNPTAKLSNEDVKTIRALKGQVSYRKLAKRFGVCLATIVEIQSGRSWKHLP